MRKSPNRELVDSRRNKQEIGSVIPQNLERMFYKFDRQGTTASSLAKAYQTPERTVCEIIRTRYHGLIQQAKKAS